MKEQAQAQIQQLTEQLNGYKLRIFDAEESLNVYKELVHNLAHHTKATNLQELVDKVASAFAPEVEDAKKEVEAKKEDK